MITVKALAWAAGFLEGEGSFNAPNRKIGSTVAVSAAQVQREPLERLRGIFGGGISGRRNGTVLAWVIYGPRAAGVMMTVYSMMSPRRKVAIRRALAGWHEQRLAGLLRTHCPKGHPFTTDNLLRNKDGHRVCRECNKAWCRRARVLKRAATGEALKP